MRRKAKRIWAGLLVLLLLFSVTGGSSFSVRAEEEGASVVTEAETEAETAEEKDEKQDMQEETEVPEETEATETEKETEVPEETKAPETTETEETVESVKEESEATVEEEPPGTEEPAEPVFLSLEEPEPSVSLTRRKYAERRADGTYDLTLEITGKTDTTSTPRKLDVLLIVDESGSMKETMNDGSGKNRWESAKAAAAGLVNTLAANRGLDVRYSIVGYSGDQSDWDRAYNDARVRLDWSSAGNGDLVYQSLAGEPSGGTNYQAGLRTGAEQLQKARSDAEKAVLFLSDGKPTYYYNASGKTVGHGNEDADGSWWGELVNPGSCSGAAYTQADAMTGIQYFYTIGIGKDENAINPDTLKELSRRIAAANQGGCKVREGNEPYLCGSLEELKSAFREMAGHMLELVCTDVTITDVLSENVALLDQDGKILTGTAEPVYTLSVLDADGKAAGVPEGTSVQYDGASRRLTLDFPDSYELEDGWTYRITLHMKPSEAAYGKYFAAGEAYPDRADADTGTHAEGLGFYSNDGAKVTYLWNGNTPREEAFPRPVVKLDGVDIPVPTGLTLDGQLEGGWLSLLLGLFLMTALCGLRLRKGRRHGT